MRRLKVLTAALLVVPPLVAAVQALADYPAHEIPIGDRALLEIEVERASHGQAILGPHCRYGWRHPGPLMSYLVVPAFVIGGRTTASLRVATALYGALFLALALVAGWRATSREEERWVLTVGTGLVGAMIAVGAPRGAWSDFWNPVLALVPLWAAIVLGAVVASGRSGWLAALVFVHALAVQTHVACGLAATVALGFGLASLARRLRGAAPSEARRALGVAAVVGAAAWGLPLWEAARSDGGNLLAMLRWAATHEIGRDASRWTEAARRAAFPVADLFNGREGSTWTLLWALLALALLAGLARSAARAGADGTPFERAFVASTVLQVGAAIVAVGLLVGAPYGYLLLWLLPVVGAVWTSLFFVIARRVPPARRAQAGFAAVVALVGLQLWQGLSLAPPARANEAIEVASCLVERSDPERVELRLWGPRAWGVGAGVGLQLVRGGHAARLVPAERTHFGDAFAYSDAALPAIPQLSVARRGFRRRRSIGSLERGALSADFDVDLARGNSAVFLGPGWSRGAGSEGRRLAEPTATVEVALWPRVGHELTLLARSSGGGTLAASVDGRDVGRTPLGASWRTATFSVPPLPEGRHHVELRSDPAAAAVFPEVAFVRLSPRLPDVCAAR